MYLSDTDIKKAVEAGGITISGFDETRLQPASYDIMLGNEFLLPEPHRTDFVDPVNGVFPAMREVTVADSGRFTLHPGISALAKSWDSFGSDKYLVQLSGKSSLARIGLIVHNTAGIINPGHYLNITLELYNLSHTPIVLRPRMPIAQITFSELSSPTMRSYQEVGRYSDQNWQGAISPKGTKQ